MLDTGRTLRIPMEVTEAVHAACESARSAGLGSADAVRLVRHLIDSTGAFH